MGPRDGAISELRRTWSLAIAAPERLTVSEWADRHRILTSEASQESGPWRTDRYPFLRGVMDALSVSDPCGVVVFQKSSQVGGTECLLNWAGETIHQDPCPMMIVSSNDGLSRRLVTQRLDPMIDDCPELRELVGTTRQESLQGKGSGKRRAGSDSTVTKRFPGGVLMLTTSRSSAGLRQAPVRKVALDEVDDYPLDVDGQGDPVELARARQRNFSKRKTFLLSSPTIEGLSRIAREFETSDQSYYLVPCPTCNHEQRLVWSNLDFERDAFDQRIPETGRYICEGCGALIPEHQKTWMLERGRWVPKYPERSRTVRGFHISALYAPVGTFSWADICRQWNKAQGNPEELKVFTNTVLGETWTDRGAAPTWEKLYNRRENYPIGTCPSGVLVLTAGIDVQADRLEVEVCGWGRELESWAISYDVVVGEPSKKATWRDLERILAKSWPAEDVAPLTIRAVAIDAGYDTANVHGWARRHRGLVYPVKGGDSPVLIGQPKRVDVTRRGKKVRSGTKSWPVGVGVVKRQLYGWLLLEQPTEPDVSGYPPGWCHFPQLPAEYFEQLCAERAVPKLSRHGFRWEWTKTRARNEALDTRVYNRAAAAIVGLDRYSAEDWDELEQLVARPPRDSDQEGTPNEDEDPADDFWDSYR